MALSLRSVAAAAALANVFVSASCAVTQESATCVASDANCDGLDDMAMLQVSGRASSKFPFHVPDFKMPDFKDFKLPETGIDLPGIELPKSVSELSKKLQKMDVGKLKEVQEKLEAKLKSGGGGAAEEHMKTIVDQLISHKGGSLLETEASEEFPKFDLPDFKLPETGIDIPGIELPKSKKDLMDFKLPETGIDIPGIELPKSPQEFMDKIKKMEPGELKRLGDELHDAPADKAGLKDQLEAMVKDKMKGKMASLKDKMKKKLHFFR